MQRLAIPGVDRARASHNETEIVMRLFLATVALTAVIASPVLAAPLGARDAYAATAQGDEQFLAASPSPYQHHAAYDVYVNGNYVGSDPDPFIRELLRQESGSDVGDH